MSDLLEVTVIGLLIVFPALGVWVRRWSVVALPLICWPLFYMGMNRGWWLDGTGDGWEFALVLLTGVGLITTALAVQISRYVKPPTKGARFRAPQMTSVLP
jgi:hypothetical protein